MQPLKSTEAYQLTQTVRYGRGRSCYFNEVWQYAASDSSDTAAEPPGLSVITIKGKNVWMIIGSVIKRGTTQGHREYWQVGFWRLAKVLAYQEVGHTLVNRPRNTEPATYCCYLVCRFLGKEYIKPIKFDFFFLNCTVQQKQASILMNYY